MSGRWQAGSHAVRTMARGVRAGAARLRPLVERRKAGRIKGGKVNCNWGRVIDISRGGMRVRAPRRLRGRLAVKIWTHHRRVTVPAAVVWSQRAGFRKYDVGLEFQDVTEDIKRELTAIGLYASHG